jgi:hypothetical protein
MKHSFCRRNEPGAPFIRVPGSPASVFGSLGWQADERAIERSSRAFAFAVAFLSVIPEWDLLFAPGVHP